jgi:FkbM family methyltransferase
MPEWNVADMDPRYAVALTDTIERIWMLVASNSGCVGDRFERIIQSFYTKTIREGDAVVDGGAHMGLHAIPLARVVGARGRVLAFEPLRPVADKLRVLLSGMDLMARVDLRSEAIARDIGQRTFYIVENMLEFSGLHRREYVGFAPNHIEITVDVTTLDATIQPDLPPGTLSFIKLDLEGGEFRALQGAERVLRTHEPCCAFENGLASSASDYDAAEFFAFFEGLDYELYDIFGNRIHQALWSRPGPWYVMAIPRSHSQELVPLLHACALEQFLAAPWPRTQFHPPPTTSALQQSASDSAVVGAMDHLESVVRLSGWAVDASSAQPVRSLIVTIDDQPVATIYPDKPRYDVVAALGRVSSTNSGFEGAVPFATTQRIAVHAEAADGTFKKIAENASVKSSEP